jgi:hypothetical protein
MMPRARTRHCFHGIDRFLTSEEAIMSLIKIIVFTVIVILSILFFWRFLF